jgi:hypothetical protein
METPHRTNFRGFIRRRWKPILVIAFVIFGAAVWPLVRHFFAASLTPADSIRWLPFGAIGVIVLVVVLHSFHEERLTRRVVASALQGRAPATDEEFARRFYAPALAPIAARLRCMLADCLGCDLSAMIPSDDFEKWLNLSPGPDSAADVFFEELAVEFQLTRDCPWPERFGSFDALLKFVAEHAQVPKTP